MKIFDEKTTNPDWEKKQYALFEAKRIFYIETQDKGQLTYDDSVAIDWIQRLDTAFVEFVKQKTGTEVITDVEGACVTIVGQDKISQLLADMRARRLTQLTQYLEDKVDEQSRFSVREAEQKDKINYKDRPKFLIRFDAAGDSLAVK